MLNKVRTTFLLVILTFVYTSVHADHSIYMLLTHPRATATAFERVIRTQKNITVLHAPFLDPYLAKKYGPDHRFTRSLSNPNVTFEDVRNHLFKLAEKSPVFFKESGYLLVDYLKANPDFYRNSQVKIAFLVRDPAKSILSYYLKMPTVDESIIGHRQLWDLFVMMKDQLQPMPLVIDSDEFLKDPLYVLNMLGERWGLQFTEDNLKWEKGYANDWRLKDWYVDVAESTELGEYRGDVPREKDGTPKYLEVTDEKDRVRLQNLYRSQIGYYQKLMQFAIKTQK